MDTKKLRLLQLIVVICVVLPGPFVFLGMLKEAQFTFGFTLITIFNLQRETVLDAIKEKGFYLQLPPPKEDLLKQHKADMSEQNQTKKEVSE